MEHEVVVHTSSGMHRFTIDDTFFSSLSETEKANKDSIALFVASSLALLADSPLGSDKPLSVYYKFLSKLKRDGIRNTIIRFTSLAHNLISQVTFQGSASIGPWIDAFRDTPVFKEYHEFYRTGKVDIVRWIYTFLNFGKKLEFVDPLFDETAFRGWLDNEKRLADLVLPQDIVDSIQLILREVLPTFSIQDFRPKFGPGAVSERGVRQRIQKLRNFSYDAVIDRFFFHGHIGKYGCGEDSGLTVEKVIPSLSQWDPAIGCSSRSARLMFVPKNIKTSRSICMEPNTLMFFQQGVLDTMRELLRISKLNMFIRLEDQSFNRNLSKIGSLSNSIDTIDLSSASDLLSYELVKKVFPPSWQIPMRATRSRDVILPDGTVIPIKKFAPMGSALCFPTQCIIFCAVCILAACRYTYENSGSIDSFASWLTPRTINECIADFWQHTSLTSFGFQPLGIYGDDICIDSRLTDKVKSILTSLGFLVNDEKSFTGIQSFRESCGGFFIRGYDITPLYFAVKGVQDFTNPEHVASQVHMINECWRRRYKTLYRFLRHSIMTWDSKLRHRTRRMTLNPIPHVTNPDIFGILCITPSNSHLKRRYNKCYQRDEIRTWTITYTEKYPSGNLLGALDKYEYMRWWAGHSNSEASPEFQHSVSRYDTGRPGLLWRWMPEQ